MSVNGQDGSKGNGLDLEDDASYGGFFSALENTRPYLKVGFEGFAGSGKTYTGARVTIGLAERLEKQLGRKARVALFDTETAGKFLLPLFQGAGIQVLHKRSKSLVDLMKTMELMRKGAADILMIDQISHVWKSFLKGYANGKNKSRLSMQDWGILKPDWEEKFSVPLVNDPYHIVLIGRAAFEYDSELSGDEDEEKTRQIFKSGVKMQGVGELAFETDLFVYMERKEKLLDKKGKKEVWREATILKDRSALIDGQTFRNPGYEHFKPVVEFCMASAVSRATEPQGDDSALFRNGDDRHSWFKRRDVAMEELEGILVETWPAQNAEAKQKKMEALFAAFGTRSWTAIGMKKPEEVEAGVVKVKAFIVDMRGKEKAEADAAAQAKVEAEEKAAEASAEKANAKKAKKAKGGEGSEPAAA